MRNRFLAAAALATLALAACGDGPTDPQPNGAYMFTASGRVHTLNGTIPTGLTAVVTGSNGPISAVVGPDGLFTIQAQVQGDSVDVLLDVQQGTRTTLPALVRVHGRQPGSVTVALVPARWSIQGGTYHTTNVPISMDLAFRPPCITPNDTNCDGFYPTEWVNGIRIWTPSSYPIRLGFDRARSHQLISAADSTAFWNAVNQMNQDMGTVLFEPARGDQFTYANDALNRPVDAIAVRVDTTLTGFGAWTNWWWTASGDVVSGLVKPRTASLVRNPGLMTHELLHTQGFKHSCSWQTVMGGYNCGQTARLSASDVAHAQVAMEIRALQRATGALHGVGAALRGERAMLGLAALPAEILFRLLKPQADLMADGDDVLQSDHAH